LTRSRRIGLAVLVVLLAAGMVGTASAQASPRDQLVLSGSVDVPAGHTAEDVVVIDGPVNIGGTVKGNVVAVHGSIRISGFVDGTVTSVSRRVTLLPGARIHGDLLYGGAKPRIASGSTVTGKVSSEGWTQLSRPGFGVIAYLIVWLAVSISALALGTLVWWLAPGVMHAASGALDEQTGAVIGWGLGLFIGLPALAILAMITLVGIPFGIGLGLALLPLGAIGYVTGAWILGRLVLKRDRDWFVVGLTGLAIVRAVALIPWFGVLASFAATVLGLGALLVALWRTRQSGASGRAAVAQPLPGH
jgi:Polymer-forming cytoskeletal